MRIFHFCVLALLWVPTSLWAGSSLPEGYLAKYLDRDTILLASAEGVDTQRVNTLSVNEQEKPYRDRWFTLNKLHKYFAFGAIGFATAAILAPKPDITENWEESTHHKLAQTATALSLLTTASGLAFHIEDLNYGTGFYKDPDNWHALLGSLATAGFVMATRGAGDEAHSKYGMAGFASMLIAIKIVW